MHHLHFPPRVLQVFCVSEEAYRGGKEAQAYFDRREPQARSFQNLWRLFSRSARTIPLYIESLVDGF